MSKYTHNHNAAFCRTLLSETMRDVRKHFTREQIAKAWAWTGDGKDFEFHGPNGEYLYNLRMTDCLTSAKAEGWRQILNALEPDVCIARRPGRPDCACAPKNVVSSGSLETSLETSAGIWQLDMVRYNMGPEPIYSTSGPIYSLLGGDTVLGTWRLEP